MTTEELTHLKQMSGAERLRKYWPLLQQGKITKAQYDFVLSLGRENKINLETEAEPEGDDSSTGIVEGLIKEFGGHEIKTTQKERLLALLSDGEWHTTPEIQTKVYGADHLGVARIASRVTNLRNDGYKIEGKYYKKSIWMYRLSSKI